jgi:hypothetical protein
MDYEQTMQYVQEYCMLGVSRHEKAKRFKDAIVTASAKNAHIHNNLEEIREITQYIAHIAERGEKSANSFENVMGAIKKSTLYLLLMYGEPRNIRQNMIDDLMKQLRQKYPLPDPYRVPIVDIDNL